MEAIFGGSTALVEMLLSYVAWVDLPSCMMVSRTAYRFGMERYTPIDRCELYEQRENMKRTHLDGYGLVWSVLPHHDGPGWLMSDEDLDRYAVDCDKIRGWIRLVGGLVQRLSNVEDRYCHPRHPYKNLSRVVIASTSGGVLQCVVCKKWMADYYLRTPPAYGSWLTLCDRCYENFSERMKLHCFLGNLLVGGGDAGSQ